MYPLTSHHKALASSERDCWTQFEQLRVTQSVIRQDNGSMHWDEQDGSNSASQMSGAETSTALVHSLAEPLDNDNQVLFSASVILLSLLKPTCLYQRMVPLSLSQRVSVSILISAPQRGGGGACL